MNDIVIIDAVRTPVGRRNGWLRAVHPVQLGAHALTELLKRVGLEPSLVDHVLMGNVSQIGEQTFNYARNVVLDAGLPIEVPATTLDFQCGSSQQAVHLAAAMVASGQADVVIAGGGESMTRVPMGSSLAGAQPFTARIMAQYDIISQGQAADKIAAQWGIARQALDDLSYESHTRAAQATEQGWFRREIAPLEGCDENGDTLLIDRDQGIRANPDRAKMAALQPAFNADGVITAGNSSQISDGAAALLITRADHAQRLGLKPKARVVATATVGSDPHLMLTGPLAATDKVLHRTDMAFSDIDLFEVNEAFASVVGMWQQAYQADMRKVNVHGGAIALGHPLGCSGARLMTTLVHALETHDKRWGLQTMCCGGGLGTGTILERLS